MSCPPARFGIALTVLILIEIGFYIMPLKDFSKDEVKHLAAALPNMKNAKLYLVSSIRPGLHRDLSLTCYL